MQRSGYTTLTKEPAGLSLNEIWAYSIIKSFRKKEGYSDLTYKQIAEYSGIPEKTIEKIVSGLIKNPALFSKVEKVDIGNNRYRNYYYFPDYENFFYVDNKYFEDTQLYKEKAVVLLIKSFCLNNTNQCQHSRNKLAELSKVSKPTLLKYLKGAVNEGWISEDLEITHTYIYARVDKSNSIAELNTFNYEAICKLCKQHNIEPPKRVDKLLGYLAGKYVITDEDTAKRVKDGYSYYLPYVLCKRCTSLPEKVNMAYFVKVLTGIDYKPKPKEKLIITL